MACPTFGNVSYDGVPLCNDVPKLEEVLKVLQVSKEVVVAVYPYGSHIMGLASPGSGTFLSHYPFRLVLHYSHLNILLIGLETDLCWLDKAFSENFLVTPKLTPFWPSFALYLHRLGHDCRRE